ncbi:NUDIX domain-containing protein [Maridesulfovibrio bastinii]|uniref:NUDIX domain-containing protein n=1 Tax=Maridesulfovibrio bastinii TaxID=47157 RepID=UPI00041659F6|nr:NUDIX domain-containing protein [Maridesulfovibrio bastinii]
MSERINIKMATGIFVYSGKVYIQKRLDNDLWGGKWEFPGGSIEKGEIVEQALAREYIEETGVPVKILGVAPGICYSFENYHVEMFCRYCTFSGGYKKPEMYEASDGFFINPFEINGLPFARGHALLKDILLKSSEFKAILGKY